MTRVACWSNDTPLAMSIGVVRCLLAARQLQPLTQTQRHSDTHTPQLVCHFWGSGPHVLTCALGSVQEYIEVLHDDRNLGFPHLLQLARMQTHPFHEHLGMAKPNHIMYPAPPLYKLHQSPKLIRSLRLL